MTVTEWCRYWHSEIYKPKVRFSTWQGRGYVLETHICPYFETLEMEELTRKDVQEFLYKKRESYSAAMVSNISKALHLCLKAAVEQSVIPANPVDGLSASGKAKCKTKPLTEFQLAEYLYAAQGNECEVTVASSADYSGAGESGVSFATPLFQNISPQCGLNGTLKMCHFRLFTIFVYL